MSISAARVGAVVRKELTEFRRSRFIRGCGHLLV